MIDSVLSASATFFSVRFFSAIANNSTFSSEVVIALLLLGLSFIFQHATNGIGHTVIPALKFKIDRDAITRLNDKMSEFPAVWFENNEFLDFVAKGYRGTDYCFSVLVPMLRFLFKYLPYCIIVGVYLGSLYPALAWCIFLIFIPTFLTFYIRPKILLNLEDELAPVRRENGHYKQCVTEQPYFKETRTLGIYGYFKEKFIESVRRINHLAWKSEIKIKRVDFFAASLSLLGFVGVMLLLVYSLMNGHITSAMFAAVLATIGNMYVMCDDTAEHFLVPFEGVSTVKNFFSLLTAAIPQKEEKTLSFNRGLRFDNVSFSYVGVREKALDRITLEIKGGETIAIVGANGSGKTTFSKLLLGLYTPDEVAVTIDGVDTAGVSRSSVTRGMSAIFQKFQRYKMTVAQNIQLSDCRAEDADERLRMSMEQAAVDIHDGKFTDGLDTMLGRDFDGVELSGGQWQRIAIARGLYRVRDIIVLDEPTAAIDPIEETALYKKFAEISREKTAVMITHRIGSARIAGRIIVMEKGKIVETGTHEQLMENNGYYRLMFETQKKWYQ
ncbi:MAG: ABC transporter ATP-binding protein/permease [Treponema sp.]|nr:ABC transporter ATP-binding protein/permease [Treponema sp.]